MGQLTFLSCKETIVRVKVDRSSVLGNPFEMTNESQRSFVIDMFDKYLSHVLFTNQTPEKIAKDIAVDYCVNIAKAWKSPTKREIVDELNRIRQLKQTSGLVVLDCWCHPKACHAQVLMRYITQGDY